MFRLVAKKFGDPIQVLELEPFSQPAPRSGQVLVRMIASPINPSDLIPVTGAYRHRTELPFVPGFEGVGVVVDTGEAVDRTWIGRRVLPLGAAGCWQNWKTLPADWCVTVPEDISDDQAATAYINPLTASLMVHTLNPSPGDRIGITAAGSAIGSMLLRLLVARGVEPVAIIRRSTPRDAISCNGVEVVREGTTLPALDGGLDAVGGASGGRLAAAIRPGGLLLHYGLLSGEPLTDASRARIALFRLRDHVHAMPRADFHAIMARCFEDIRAGRAATSIAGRYPLANYRSALTDNDRVGRRGKILLT